MFVLLGVGVVFMSDGIKIDGSIDRISSSRTATRLSEDAVGLLSASLDAVSISIASILASGAYILLSGNTPPNTDTHLAACRTRF
jgi:hypothetical protein